MIYGRHIILRIRLHSYNNHNWLVVSTPLKNMKVSWHYCPQYMENHKIPWFQTNQNTDSRGKYGGWLRNLAPVDRWWIYVNIPLFIGYIKTIRLVVKIGFRWPIHSMKGNHQHPNPSWWRVVKHSSPTHGFPTRGLSATLSTSTKNCRPAMAAKSMLGRATFTRK